MPTARLTGQERRAAIIDSAIQLFSEKGFRGVTTRELASAIGVSEPVLYQHFPSKRDLYNAIIESIAEQSAHPCGDGQLPNCGAGLDDREFLVGVADAIIRWHENNPAFVRLFIFSALEGHELGDMFFDRHSSGFLQEIADYIRSRVDAGVFRPVEPKISAYHFIALCVHYGIGQALAHKPAYNPPRDQVLSTVVDLFLKGVQA